MSVARQSIAKALLAFLLLPGVVAFVVPLLLFRPPLSWHAFNRLGLVPLVLGVIGLLWCVRDFRVSGRGTLAPWAPPERLVVVGLYRFTRNPMYIAVLLIVGGWALAFRSPALGVYAAALCLAFHLRVMRGEEPWLARTFGEAWTNYSRSVPRWF